MGYCLSRQVGAGIFHLSLFRLYRDRGIGRFFLGLGQLSVVNPSCHSTPRASCRSNCRETLHRKIIGIGSPFGADQLGWRAIDLLKTVPVRGWKLVSLDRPGSDLIRHFQGVNDLVLIDAVQSGRTPGAPRMLRSVDLAASECRTSTHGFGVAEVLSLAGQLGFLPERWHLIGIETGPDLTILPEIDLGKLRSLLHL